MDGPANEGGTSPQDTQSDDGSGIPPQQGEGAPAAQPSKIPYPSMVYFRTVTFEMGDTFDEGGEDEKPVHTVSLSPFQIGKYEVTFAEFDLFCEKTGFTKPGDEGWGRGRMPVVNVSWYDVISYCNWLSVQHRHTPLYKIANNRELQQRWEESNYGLDLDKESPEIVVDWKAEGFRLPTEAEWECAASYKPDGTKARFGNGKDTLDPKDVNFNPTEKSIYSISGENRQRTVPVGSLVGSENARGLFDMSGNVWEWCGDWYGGYSGANGRNPRGATLGDRRVVRGGSYWHSAGNCRVSDRSDVDPPYRHVNFGFRLVLSPSSGAVGG
jgi:formylglycine-generating enzyme required for sulfatase activity